MFKADRILATALSLIVGVCIAGLNPASAQDKQDSTPAKDEAVSKSATTRPAVANDPNYIGPDSWRRHLTIPRFVLTSRGWEMPVIKEKKVKREEVYFYYAARSSRPRDTSGTAASTINRPSYGGERASGGITRSPRPTETGRSTGRPDIRERSGRSLPRGFGGFNPGDRAFND